MSNSKSYAGNSIIGSAKCSPSVTYTRPEMPETMVSTSFADIRQAWEAYNESPIAHNIRNFEQVIDHPNTKLEQWEVDAFVKVIEKFTAKYTSPLAKALK